MLNNEEHLQILKEIVALEQTIKQQKDKLDEMSEKLHTEQIIRSRLETQYNKPIEFCSDDFYLKPEQQNIFKKNMKLFNCTAYTPYNSQIPKDCIWKELRDRFINFLNENCEGIMHTYFHKTNYQSIHSINMWFVIPDKENLK